MESAPSLPKAIAARLRALPLYGTTIALLLLAALVPIGGFASTEQVSALTNLAVAAIVCSLCDAVADRIKGKPFRRPETAVICGLIVASVLAPDTAPLTVAWVSGAAIALKHLVQVRKMPLLNPAAAGLMAGHLLLGTLHYWWASGAVALLALPFLAWKTNRLKASGAFLLAWLAMWAGTALIGGGRAASLEGLLVVVPLYLAAFMVPEPKTSPVRTEDQMVYGAMAGAGAVLLPLAMKEADGLLLALLLANLGRVGMDRARVPPAAPPPGAGAAAEAPAKAADAPKNGEV